MPATTGEIFRSLAAIPSLQVAVGVPLASYARFAIGGPAGILAETPCAESLVSALRVAKASGLDWMVIGGGCNLIVADEGFPGIVVRFTESTISAEGARVRAGAGAELQVLVDFTIERGLSGLETLTRIPGWVGAAVYGNAGAYGHSISERVWAVTFFDGESTRTFTNQECEFHYRESVFKRRKEWVILSVTLDLEPGEQSELRRVAADIELIRDRKFPPSMKCAGSVFKNLLLAELPSEVAAQVPQPVVREGKIPAAWFLEQVGAKGMVKGGIRVADYHANLPYNAGGGTARDLCGLIAELKMRVRARFGLDLEEEVQYVGF